MEVYSIILPSSIHSLSLIRLERERENERMKEYTSITYSVNNFSPISLTQPFFTAPWTLLLYIVYCLTLSIHSICVSFNLTHQIHYPFSPIIHPLNMTKTPQYYSLLRSFQYNSILFALPFSLTQCCKTFDVWRLLYSR